MCEIYELKLKKTFPLTVIIFYLEKVSNVNFSVLCVIQKQPGSGNFLFPVTMAISLLRTAGCDVFSSYYTIQTVKADFFLEFLVVCTWFPDNQ